MANKSIVDVDILDSLADSDSLFVNSDGSLKQVAVEDAGLMRMELLWENASPTSEFAAQTLTFDDDGYTEVEVHALWSISYYGFGMAKFTKGETINAKRLDVVNGADTFRIVTCKWEDGKIKVTFTTATYYGSYNGNASSSTTHCIPTQIYGIKGIQ